MKVGGPVPGPSSGSGRLRRAAARPGSPPRQLAPQSNYSRFASTSCAKRRLSAERPVCELRIPYDSWPARSCLLPDRGGDAALKSGAERSALYATTSCKAQQLVLVPSAAAGGSAGGGRGDEDELLRFATGSCVERGPFGTGLQRGVATPIGQQA